MKSHRLIVRNNQGQEFQHNCREFIGYDVFVQARKHWGYDWQTYVVLDGDTVIESVINPNDLDPSTAVSIH